MLSVVNVQEKKQELIEAAERCGMLILPCK